ncbi:MAG: ribonuclease HII [Gammaproteobacteria bacterium RIFCSPHIGHO2_12_FULL_35_23]|nr:MAG: ribonuclease HII [Gammaproteobacteria bacterium RIFCSPHIGHO2_12_FULL_35_23]
MWVAGVDEAGRGPLAGPVVAAAVILNPEKPIIGLDDSKKLSVKQRETLYELILSHALDYGIASASVAEIDELNIFQASLLAMQRAVNQLTVKLSKILVDGTHCPQVDCLAEAIIGGDAKVEAISAASILAKVTRDREMIKLHELYPQYGFAKHKGYGTKAHQLALQQYGASPLHRQSFAPVREQLNKTKLNGYVEDY